MVKDVGASHDGLVDLFQLDLNKVTGQFRKCSIDSIERFLNCLEIYIGVPRWYSALL